MLPRVKLVLALFLLAGIGAFLIAPKRYEAKTEAWMESAVPLDIPGYRMTGSSQEGVRMTPEVYEILKPFGIVIRQFSEPNSDKNIDFTVIAGNTRKSFHDPQVCFTAQNWELQKPHVVNIDIKALGGQVPATVMSMVQQGKRGTALYFYHSPMGYRATPLIIPFDLTAAKLMLKDDADAQFFRFILSPATEPENDTKEALEKSLQADVKEIEKFANAAFDTLQKTQNGRYFVSR